MAVAGAGDADGRAARTTNADAGAGFYSHHAGYLPFAFSTLPLDRVQLGRVVVGAPEPPR